MVVIGGGGAQAQATLGAATRAGSVDGWVAVDHAWREREKRACEAMGMRTLDLDLREQPDRLRELALDADLVANFAGPFYRTGTAVLEACIDAGCDYVDICDDADATLEMLCRDDAAKKAGVRALIGMGSSPGLANLLVRAARDWLGEADEVNLSWVVDVVDVSDAALQHFWHSFAPFAIDGRQQPVPAWEDLSLRTVTFPEPLGDRLVIGLSHPEPITIPLFLDVEAVHSFGSIVPEDSLVVNWTLARLGASGGAGEGGEASIPGLASDLYRRYLQTRAPTPYLGAGLVVDVWSGEEGVRFTSAGKISMAESTGISAAAGILLMLEAGPEEAGVVAPECLDPAEFFPRLGRTSRGTGSLGAYRLWGNEEGVRIRIRDLLRTRTRSF